ncbi:MAG: translation initiation factor IF-2 [Phycisphaeraceae bacterium]|nr:translation initiation factor IF-2 [Phycisphaeraceae bacterium]
MAKSLKVSDVAKELGVESKAIIEKCKAEGIANITRHSSTVKMGLYLSIKEWFAHVPDEAATSIESATDVEIKKPRATSRRRAAAKKDDESSASTATLDRPESEVPTETDDAAASPDDDASPRKARRAARARPTTETEAKEDAQPDVPAKTEPSPAPGTPQPSIAETPTEQDAPPAAPSAAPPTDAGDGKEGRVAARKKEPVRPVGVPNVPQRPDTVAPAGERLSKPTSVTLRGPNLVRLEKPDPIAPPRPRPRPSPGVAAGAGAGSGGPDVAGGGSRLRGRGRSDRPSEGDSDARRNANKRRSMTTRRGRYGESLPSGPAKLTDADVAELDARLSSSAGFIKRNRHSLRKREPGNIAQSALVTGGKVTIEEPIFIKELSARTGIKAGDVLKFLFKRGTMATINSAIDAETAMEVCLEYNIELEVREQANAADRIEQDFEKRQEIDVQPRPPVVTVLGHVDHGKTSLLDRIRKADVAAHEDGGITQHVGAYRVNFQTESGEDRTVVFLDTPGHEAFTSMRSRGASLTDVVVLVVAADDGVMPQTIESINHAKAAGVPIVVALNKVDRPEVDDNKYQQIYGQLAAHGLNPVPWGGDTEVVPTSAISGQGVTELLEILDLQSQMLELKADYGGPARGTVIETEMQEGRGPVARVLVQQGHIKVGDFIVIGRAFGRVRDMTDDRDRSIREAGPSTPLELSGIDMVPDAGNKFFVTETLQRAEEVALHFREIERNQQLASKTKVTLANFAEQLATGQTKDLRVVLKADVQGSIDVLRKSLEELGNKEVAVRVLHSAVGPVSESDILLSDASDAVILGFHVVASGPVRDIAEAHQVDIRLYRVIYDLINDVKASLEGMLAPEIKEEILGQAEVRQTFRVSKVGNVAGCLVIDGVAQRGCKVRVERDGIVVTDRREVDSLKRVKDDAREVRAGTECGIHIAGFDDVKPGDTITFYRIIEVKRKLE